MALSLRERRLVQAAAGLLVLVLLLVWLLRGDRPAELPAAVVAPPPLVAAPAPPAPAPDLSGLRLHGLLATGAILGFADGSQRFVPLGREVVAGMRLERIEQNGAVFAAAGGESRLGFDGTAQGQRQGQATPLAPAAGEAALRHETLGYRLGLAPRRTGARVTGFTMRPGARLPALERAGIRPGDTIVGVNGSRFDEERMGELAWQIANSARTEFEVERGGRRLRLALEGR